MDYGNGDNLVAGRGMVDDVSGTPQDFGRATFDAYLDRLVAARPVVVEYFLFEHDQDTEWRILVRDVPGTGYYEDEHGPSAR
ncbi:hypothetical protein ACIBO5_57960 [Nonomuraea angiospora]|uniref:hypothetical protein n=1 Tax=Nonomuraea angiospora TaxID=46172 RepID=UPI0029AC4071|nr:hypothetical protein [Nonomuraea angiospora]MDX3104109.1 hypothetical protein [Nonomuraea angiospora]